jgi:hypothetical protein
MKKVIDSTTSAGTFTFFVPTDKFVSIAQVGLSGAEIINIEVDLAGTWVQILPAVILNVSINMIQLGGPGTYRIVKPSTVNPTEVYLEE